MRKIRGNCVEKSTRGKHDEIDDTLVEETLAEYFASANRESAIVNDFDRDIVEDIERNMREDNIDEIIVERVVERLLGKMEDKKMETNNEDRKEDNAVEFTDEYAEEYARTHRDSADLVQLQIDEMNDEDFDEVEEKIDEAIVEVKNASAQVCESACASESASVCEDNTPTYTPAYEKTLKQVREGKVDNQVEDIKIALDKNTTRRERKHRRQIAREQEKVSRVILDDFKAKSIEEIKDDYARNIALIKEVLDEDLVEEFESVVEDRHEKILAFAESIVEKSNGERREKLTRKYPTINERQITFFLRIADDLSRIKDEEKSENADEIIVDRKYAYEDYVPLSEEQKSILREANKELRREIDTLKESIKVEKSILTPRSIATQKLIDEKYRQVQFNNDILYDDIAHTSTNSELRGHLDEIGKSLKIVEEKKTRKQLWSEQRQKLVEELQGLLREIRGDVEKYSERKTEKPEILVEDFEGGKFITLERKSTITYNDNLELQRVTENAEEIIVQHAGTQVFEEFVEELNAKSQKLLDKAIEEKTDDKRYSHTFAQIRHMWIHALVEKFPILRTYESVIYAYRQRQSANCKSNTTYSVYALAHKFCEVYAYKHKVVGKKVYTEKRLKKPFVEAQFEEFSQTQMHEEIMEVVESYDESKKFREFVEEVYDDELREVEREKPLFIDYKRTITEVGYSPVTYSPLFAGIKTKREVKREFADAEIIRGVVLRLEGRERTALAQEVVENTIESANTQYKAHLRSKAYKVFSSLIARVFATRDSGNAYFKVLEDIRNAKSISDEDKKCLRGWFRG